MATEDGTSSASQSPDDPPPGSGAHDRATAPALDILAALIQLLAAIGALVGWLVVVGGVRVHNRLAAAQLPNPVRTVTLLPREELLSEGIRALGSVVLVAAAAAVALVMLAAAGRDRAAIRRAAVPVAFGLMLGGAVAFTIIDQEDRDAEQWGLAAVAGLTLAIATLALIAMARSTTARRLAWVTAGSILAWGTGYLFVTERAQEHPKFEPVQFVRDDGTGSSGLLLAASDKELVIICVGSSDNEDSTWRSLFSVHRKDLRRVSFQRVVAIDEYEKRYGATDRKPPRDCRTRPATELAPPTEPPVPVEETQDGGNGGTDGNDGNDGKDGQEGQTGDPGAKGGDGEDGQNGTDGNDGKDGKDGKDGEDGRIVFIDPLAPTDADARGPRIPSAEQRTAWVDREHRFVYVIGRFSERVTGVASFRTEAPVRLPSGDVRRVRISTRAYQALRDQQAIVRPATSAFVRRLIQRRDGLAVRAVIVARDRLGNATRSTKQVVLRMKGQLR